MAFSDVVIEKIWQKGLGVDGYDERIYRKDVCGAWMQKDQYGKEVALGWEIDHVYPESKGGDDQAINLRPMHWENNRSKGDDYPKYKNVKTSNGTKNIDCDKIKTVADNLQIRLKELYKIK